MITANPYELARGAGARSYHFHGGLHLRHNKQISCRDRVERPPLPQRLVVPLLQHTGEAAAAVVAVGEQLLKGQVIGQCEYCASIHAPVSGTVAALEDLPMSNPFSPVGPCIVIKPDPIDQWVELSPIREWRDASPERLIKQMQECGLAGLGGAVFPSHIKARVARQRPVHTLILNGAECEPYISCDEMLMREKPEQIVLGARILRRALGAERVVIGIEDQMGAVEVALQHAVKSAHCQTIAVVRVTRIYPEGGERQLIQALTGLEVPAGGLPSELGLVCYNVATAAAVNDAVVNGKPLIERYVTVTGNGIARPRNLLALIGTPFSHLVEACGGYTKNVARLVVGGPMMGFAVKSDETPVVKAVNCVLALTLDDVATPQAEMPCIRCGECARACPAKLLPQQLHLQISNALWQQSEDYGLGACIECGCCDFVCPSHIPLVEWFRYGKGQLRQRTIEAGVVARARQRFEAREARLLRDEQQRTEKILRTERRLYGRTAQQQSLQAAIERAGKRRKTRRGSDAT